MGWSLGANDAANVFGTAVGTKMLRFKTAAIIASIFVVIGAVIGGAGATHTLGKLGAVNAIAGSFVVAFSAGFTVLWMTRLKLPVSTSQAIVGAIIGWNFFSGSATDYSSLTKIVSTWVLCPLLSAAFSMILYFLFKNVLEKINVHLLSQDFYTRVGLVAVGAFGAYSLGANNIANVMGVFVPVTPFKSLNVYGLFTLSSAQILFFIGALAIAVGVFTYSYKVMDTVGGNLLKISPVAALIVVLAESLVLFIFSSEGLESWLLSHGLPAIPLVPVSSSQAVVGGVIGIGLVKGGRGIRFNVLGEIATGWVTTPIAAGILTFVSLFFFQNVFDQQVSYKNQFRIDDQVIEHLQKEGLEVRGLEQFKNQTFTNSMKLSSLLERSAGLTSSRIQEVLAAAKITHLSVDSVMIATEIDREWFTAGQINALKQLSGKRFQHKWQLKEALQKLSADWRFRRENRLNRLYNKEIKKKLDYIFSVFKESPQKAAGNKIHATNE